jgi:hypothetical protein
MEKPSRVCFSSAITMNLLILQHIAETPDSTVSGLLLNGTHLCYIIEDGHREVKVKGETRIPAGTYELFPRESGGFWDRYKRRFGHDFVIGFRSVPGFKWILFHIGNNVGNTEGCLLCNAEYKKDADGNYMGVDSLNTYLALHDTFKELFNDGEVFIKIDRGVVPDVVPGPSDDEPVQDEPVGDEPVVADPDEPTPKDIGCGGLAVILLIASLFGAAIGMI